MGLIVYGVEGGSPGFGERKVRREAVPVSSLKSPAIP